jgi:hypothetical protein
MSPRAFTPLAVVKEAPGKSILTYFKSALVLSVTVLDSVASTNEVKTKTSSNISAVRRIASLLCKDFENPQTGFAALTIEHGIVRGSRNCEGEEKENKQS